MRIYLVVEETVFFHPEFVKEFLDRTKDEIVGASLVTAVKKKSNIERYMISHFYYLTCPEIWKMGTRQIKQLAADKWDPSAPHSVRRVLEEYRIPYERVKYDINTDEHLSYIENRRPDVILSSQSLYFGKRLLSIPSRCCINRHSGLLPRNGGLWPGFQAVRKGETETGVSIHTMESRIDDGIVLSQIRIPIRYGETVWDIYRECFKRSAEAVLEALDKIRKSDYSPVENGYEREYYSFPTKVHWREFRERGGRYV